MVRQLRTAALHAKTARRLVRRGGVALVNPLGPLDERLVFVVGSPRSGTTFVGRSLGSLPGFVDLGEVAALKAAIPRLAIAPQGAATARIRSILDLTRRLGLVGGARAVEQTPETSFVLRAALAAYPQARAVHVLRDGRDVVCSLLERGWLDAERTGTDDAGRPYGPAARFWVEPERATTFPEVSEARRAAWAWRRYVGAARSGGERVVEVRYEELVADPSGVAMRLAEGLDVPVPALEAALAAAHGESVGRFRRELSEEQLADVLVESGDLLAELGYVA